MDISLHRFICFFILFNNYTVCFNLDIDKKNLGCDEGPHNLIITPPLDDYTSKFIYNDNDVFNFTCIGNLFPATTILRWYKDNPELFMINESEGSMGCYPVLQLTLYKVLKRTDHMTSVFCSAIFRGNEVDQTKKILFVRKSNSGNDETDASSVIPNNPKSSITPQDGDNHQITAYSTSISSLSLSSTIIIASALGLLSILVLLITIYFCRHRQIRQSNNSLFNSQNEPIYMASTPVVYAKLNLGNETVNFIVRDQQPYAKVMGQLVPRTAGIRRTLPRTPVPSEPCYAEPTFA